MGIFTNRRAPATGWYADGSAGIAGDIGGDIQRGEAHDVRFVRDDKPGSSITVTFYAVEYDECPGEFVVQRLVEWFVGDPADGREIWSDCAADDDGVIRSTEARAEADARESAEATVAEAEVYGDWDGEPG
jgi:hypothetical protein